MPTVDLQGDEFILRGKAYHDHQQRVQEEREQAPKFDSVRRGIDEQKLSIEALTNRLQEAEAAVVSLRDTVELGRQENADSNAILRSEISRLAAAVSAIAEAQERLLVLTSELATSVNVRALEPAKGPAHPEVGAHANTNDVSDSTSGDAEPDGGKSSRSGLWGSVAAVLFASVVLVTGAVYAWPVWNGHP